MRIFETLICINCGVQWNNPSCESPFYMHCRICGSGQVHDLEDIIEDYEKNTPDIERW